MSDDSEKYEAHIRELLAHFGEDCQRKGTMATPKRFYQSLAFFLSGKDMVLEDLVSEAYFPVNDAAEMIVVHNIEFYSLCEHHMLPFFGKCHVAYIPDKKVIGLSKIPRIVDAFSRRLQIQESLTHEIAEALMDLMKPKGVGVMMEASHLCMMMRGVQKQNSCTLTTALLGELKLPEVKADFFSHVRACR
jgi:GTP cyclohydrolase I